MKIKVEFEIDITQEQKNALDFELSLLNDRDWTEQKKINYIFERYSDSKLIELGELVEIKDPKEVLIKQIIKNEERINKIAWNRKYLCEKLYKLSVGASK